MRPTLRLEYRCAGVHPHAQHGDGPFQRLERAAGLVVRYVAGCSHEPAERGCPMTFRQRSSPGICLLLVLLLFSPWVSPSEPTYSPQQLQEDFQILRTTLEEAHPGLYLYADKAARDAQFDAVFEKLDRKMTGIEFFHLIAPLVADIHDAHTVVWPSPQSAIYSGEQDAFFPLRLRFIEGNAYVQESLVPDAAIARGTEVLSIDGLAMPGILERLLPYVPHDGHIETGKHFLLGKFFPLYYGWVFGPSTTFKLRTRDPMTGQEANVELPAINVVDIAAITSQASSTDHNLDLEILEKEAIAIMTIRWFGDRGIEPFFETSFSKLQELDIQDLVIDLRGNGGGDGHHGAMLYSYLTSEPFRYYDHLGAVLDGPLTYLEHTDQSQLMMDDILARIERTDAGERYYPHWYGLDAPQKGRYDSFAGNVYFLIDGGSGSSTTEFSAIAHSNRRGVFVGEETGGTYYGNNSGTMPNLTLPNTGIVVVVPLFQFVMAASNVPNDRGIVPDYSVTHTVADFVAGVDTELAFTLDLIQNSR
jgi:hypothetical protein